MESIIQSMRDESLIQDLPSAILGCTGLSDNLPVMVHQPNINLESDINIISLSQNLSTMHLSTMHLETSAFDKEREKVFDDANVLLHECLCRKTRTREKAEKAVSIIKQYIITEYYEPHCRGIVYFPDLLHELLMFYREHGILISEDDLGSMFARCVEQRTDETFATESIKHLLEFKGNKIVEIKLLPGKYIIDSELYEHVKIHGVRDSYYDAGEPIKYQHHNILIRGRSNRYTGYRDAYHILLYGEKEHLQSLIVSWDVWGEDCTIDAACDFFKLGPRCPIEIIQARINDKCSTM